MVRWLAVALAVLVSLGTLSPTPVRARVSPPIQWTTTALKAYPPAANGVSVAPSGSIGVVGAWTTIVASTPAFWVVAGVVYNPPITGSGGPLIELGIGGAGSETVIASVRANSDSNPPGRVPFPFPFDNISPGSRLSIRMAIFTTNTSAWTFALTYYEKPLNGFLVTSTVPMHYVAPVNTTCGDSGSWGAWNQVLASSTGAFTITSIASIDNGFGLGQVEIQLGTGGSGSETPIVTVNRPGRLFGTWGNDIREIYPPYGPVASGTRYAMRCRLNSAESHTDWLWFHYYADLTGSSADSVRTTAASALYPLAATFTQPVGSWVNSSWQQLTAATAADIAVNAIQIQGSASPNEYECDLGVGGSGSEVPITTVSTTWQSGASAWLQHSLSWLPIAPAARVAAGSRLSVRCRSTTGSVDTGIVVGYLTGLHESLSTGLAHASYPPASAASLTPAGTAWNNSAYAELVASTATDVLLTRLLLRPVDSVEYEVDLATGGAGSETVFTTVRGRAGQDLEWTKFPAAHLIPAGSRIAARFRKASTHASVWIVKLDYIEDGGLTAPAGVPAVFLMAQARDAFLRLARAAMP